MEPVETIALYLFSFLAYAFIGWLGEIVYVRATEKKWVNRSFVNAPLFLLYGAGAIGPVMLFSATTPVWVTVCSGVFYAAIIEYGGSVLMEKIGLSYWDYSKNRLNLNGRICFESMTVFAVGIYLAVYIVQPLLVAFFDKINTPYTLAVVYGVFLYVVVDLAVRARRQYLYFKQIGHVVNYAFDRKPS